ncbi:beta-1,3-galactosyl-O-glycosyl-glycoprotein beta-1,6-N-acetylglucosaminyltransferase 4 isoform X2 [Vombatus ursinus]|uniref:beta-1,3-galactosyl-O-glycosyl-glycoprotein beta-1,6-N-acetylglucosaminyltransferase 4 isoform X2 n=1 Tax=Vombatus ursinus TaxID=29139 RepID=UPI000FFD6690|nr:beta-1,3-galactosyl-O-glycosyl-glycoprotein beta-1,6-N-acetylglucosaminyltransferase 4 isoform X2 [Vombatus ursinus]
MCLVTLGPSISFGGSTEIALWAPDTGISGRPGFSPSRGWPPGRRSLAPNAEIARAHQAARTTNPQLGIEQSVICLFWSVTGFF